MRFTTECEPDAFGTRGGDPLTATYLEARRQRCASDDRQYGKQDHGHLPHTLQLPRARGLRPGKTRPPATSWTLFEQVAFDAERILSRDWRSYPILRFSQCPQIEVHLLDRPNQPPLGAGEAAQGPTAAAIANAVADATGARLRDLPLTAERVRAALGDPVPGD